jgi:hypothetical protein
VAEVLKLEYRDYQYKQGETYPSSYSSFGATHVYFVKYSLNSFPSFLTSLTVKEFQEFLRRVEKSPAEVKEVKRLTLLKEDQYLRHYYRVTRHVYVSLRPFVILVAHWGHAENRDRSYCFAVPAVPATAGEVEAHYQASVPPLSPSWPEPEITEDYDWDYD